jgi:3'-5' exoribonuclease
LRASFLATDSTVRKDSRGVPYLSLKLVDRTGSVDARMWGKLPEEFLHETPSPAYVDVEGHTHEYRGTLQVKLDRLRLLRPEDISEEDYLPATELDRRALAAELESAGRELENEHLRGLFVRISGRRSAKPRRPKRCTTPG